jgi:hypothetical protein
MLKNIRELIHEDLCQTILELADTIGISYGVCQEILTENLNLRHISVKFVPQLLTNDRKRKHVWSYERKLMRTHLLSLGS